MRSTSTDQRFRQIFRANFDAIQAYCLRRLPVEEASDAVSDVFLVAWRRFDEMPSGDAARLWLFGVARNAVRNRARSARRQHRTAARVAGLAVANPDDPQTQVVAAAEHREIMAAFHHLSHTDQEILRLRLWEELSINDIATVVGCNVKAASKRYERALSRLIDATSKPSVQWAGPRLAPRGGEK